MTREQARASLIENAKNVLSQTKSMYRDRLKDGWTLGQIDEMDIHFYFSLYAKEAEQKVYIDQIW